MNKKNKLKINDLLSLDKALSFTFPLHDEVEKEQTFQSFTSPDYEDLLGHLILLSLPTPSQHIH